MRKKRTPIMLALTGLIASLITFVSSGTAVAAESLPEMQWSPVQAEASRYPLTTSPQGDVTIGCGGSVTSDFPQDVVTWGTSGTETRHITRTPQVDGKDNCIDRPVVDKNGDLYGGLKSGYLYGYDGNTLKWKYSTSCTYYLPKPVIGADGNIYFINNSGRLIGLTPDVQPPLTTPAKVLDVATSNGQCRDQLHAYKDGLRRIDYNGMATYHAYDGTYLGSSNTNTDHAPINAAGRLFSPTFTGSGDNRGVEISAYDPTTKKVAWTAQEPMSFYQTYPTPDGGAVVYGERARVVNGAPTSERVRALVKLNASGIKMWDKDLPNTDTSGVDTAGNNYITVDTTGKLVLVRDWTKQVTGHTGGVPFITIDVLNVATGEAVSSPKVMSGNTVSSEGEIYGYKIMNTPAIGPNTVYVPAQQCSRYCYGDGETKVYPVSVPGLSLDYPRGAVLAREKRPSTPYLALGDSYSAGEGVEPFEPGTNFSSVNECHRSDNAYARLISGSSPKIPALGVQGFRACSGAVTANIRYGPQWNEPSAQLDLPVWPDTTTQLVTLTIGGNDIEFGPTIKTCALEPWNCDSAFQNANAKVTNLGGVLAGTYTEILKKTPNAQVYVIGYPPMFTTGPDCPLDANGDYPITQSRKQKAIDLLNALNQKIKGRVNAVRALNNDYNQRLRFIPAGGVNSPFIGHEICSDNPYFHGLNLSHQSYSFHPNAAGQQAYAELVADAINAG